MKKEETTKIGAYIKELRESKNLGVNQLATYAGVSGAQISRIESGERKNPKPETLAKLAKALKVDYDELMSKAGYLKKEDKNETKINTAFYDYDNLDKYSDEEVLKLQEKIFEELRRRSRKDNKDK